MLFQLQAVTIIFTKFAIRNFEKRLDPHSFFSVYFDVARIIRPKKNGRLAPLQYFKNILQLSINLAFKK